MEKKIIYAIGALVIMTLSIWGLFNNLFVVSPTNSYLAIVLLIIAVGTIYIAGKQDE